jgi:hypothetical protein
MNEYVNLLNFLFRGALRYAHALSTRPRVKLPVEATHRDLQSIRSQRCVSKKLSVDSETRAYRYTGVHCTLTARNGYLIVEADEIDFRNRFARLIGGAYVNAIERTTGTRIIYRDFRRCIMDFLYFRFTDRDSGVSPSMPGF